MKRFAEFSKTTLIGGVLVILPIYIILLLLLKTVAGVAALVSPVTAQLPATLQFREVIAVAILIFVCFVAGLLLRTGPGLRTKNALDLKLLDRIPGYALIRGLAARAAGRKGDEAFAVALVDFEDALVPAFVIETHDNGAFTVFVPSVPTPVAGAIYILPKERVHFVDIPLAKALTVISKWGAGARDLVKAMPPPNGGQ
jgi:uncharacterized membrane protein